MRSILITIILIDVLIKINIMDPQSMGLPLGFGGLSLLKKILLAFGKIKHH